MRILLLAFVAIALLFPLYTYVAYPLVLKLRASLRPKQDTRTHLTDWPRISITVPVYNEEATIRATIESLLELDYPADRRQILVVSDASTDRTDEIVSEFASHGVELLGVSKRAGKTAAENAARAHLTGEIIINTDASVRIQPQAIKALVAAFANPEVGVASGRDVSIDSMKSSVNIGEKGYVGYEMWVRSLETRVSSIVQASGCLYAVRRDLHVRALPESLTRDFAAVANAREDGYRAVSVEDAICFVPRTRSLRQEYRRKVRTMTRGLETLMYKRHLLNPFRYGAYAWMVFSHKLCRWIVPCAMFAGLTAILLLSPTDPWARWLLIAAAGVALLAIVGWLWPADRQAPKILAIPAYTVAANMAAVHAWTNLLRGKTRPAWNPTRREAASSPR